jgi:hypothetical protein
MDDTLVGHFQPPIHAPHRKILQRIDIDFSHALMNGTRFFRPKFLRPAWQSLIYELGYQTPSDILLDRESQA